MIKLSAKQKRHLDKKARKGQNRWTEPRPQRKIREWLNSLQRPPNKLEQSAFFADPAINPT